VVLFSYKMGKLKDKIEMPDTQEKALVWYFGIGQSAFEKSTCGSMLDALERDSCTSKLCSTCKGVGIKGGDDYAAPGYGDWCQKCLGTGSLPVAMRRSKHALTARPKAVSSSSNAKTPSDKTLTKYASISRQVNRLQETKPESVQILAAYYGNAGTRWAQTEGYTRIFPVIVLTKPGEMLVKRAQEVLQIGEHSSGVPRDAHEQLGQLHMLNKSHPDGSRTKLFIEGERAADKLMDVAILDWMDTVKK
jgi:hypothetical protein